MAPMKKALISRYGAYGDIIHMSHLPHLLKDQGYDIVDVETNYKGSQLLSYNPHIDNLFYFEPTNYIELYKDPFMLNKHWEIISQGYDKFVNLYESLEGALIASETSNVYYMHPRNRQKYAETNYYDQSTIVAGYPELVGQYRGEVYYTDEEERIAREYMSRRKNPIIVNLNGTTLNKRMAFAPELIARLLVEFPDSELLLTGDRNSDNLNIPESDRIKFLKKIMPFRQVVLMAKYARVVVSMESGFGVAANMWETPTVQMMTAASLINHPNGCKNDFSLQSPARCSPCTKAQYKFIGCPRKDGYPLCVWFDVDTVIEQVRKAYAVWG
jgi:ADP-heptose:LPS heptosyltransferase